MPTTRYDFCMESTDCLPRTPLKRAIMRGLLAFREWILTGQAWNWPSHYHGSLVIQLFPFNVSFHSFIASSCSIGIRGFTYARKKHGNASQYVVTLLVQYHKNTYPHLLWTAPPFLSSPPWHQHVFSSTQQASPFLYHAIVHSSYRSILVYSLVFQEFCPALSNCTKVLCKVIKWHAGNRFCLQTAESLNLSYKKKERKLC